MITLKDYFKSGKDILEIGLNDTYHIYIDDVYGLCIEICDKNGNSININNVDINYKTYLDDIKTIVLNYIINNYMEYNLIMSGN